MAARAAGLPDVADPAAAPAAQRSPAGVRLLDERHRADLLAIVTLGFLGLGVPPPTPDWGTMIQEGQQFILDQVVHVHDPGLAVVLTGLALALIADGIVEKANK